MAESASDSDNEDFIPYCERAEWQDVVSIPQDDGPAPVVRIAYTEQFKDVYDYFRAILKSGEISERALQLTTDAIKMNAANYTVWHHRRVILKQMPARLKEEMNYITKTINQHPKNYQVWYHRQVIVQLLNDPSQELSFTASIINIDGKNYHAWQHRQWVIKTFSLWDGEMNFVDGLLNDDIRNNSAWNQRFFVVSNTTELDEAVTDREIKYTLDKISVVRNNESAWNYLRGIMSYTSYGAKPVVKSFCKRLYQENCRSPYLISLMVDICQEEVEKDKTKSDVLDYALALCAELAMEHDTIRAAYWTYIGNKLEEKYRVSS